MSDKNKSIAKKIALMGLFLANIIVLSTVEHMIPPIPFLPPNVKLGLSNVITMYCVYFIGKKEAVVLTVLKSFFIFLTRGTAAGFISFSGGIVSIFIIIAVVFLSKSKLSHITISILGAVAHNIGQIVAAALLLSSASIFFYFPILIFSGIIMGTVTGIVLKVILPVFNRIFH